MADFVYLFRSSEAGRREAIGTPERAQRSMQAWLTWIRGLESSGHLKHRGHPLETEGKVVRGQQKLVTDGLSAGKANPLYADNVNKMLAALVRDKRHKDVRMVSEGKLRERQFQNQSMELRVLDKDPLFSASELSEDGVGVRKIINDCFLKIT